MGSGSAGQKTLWTRGPEDSNIPVGSCFHFLDVLSHKALYHLMGLPNHHQHSGNTQKVSFFAHYVPVPSSPIILLPYAPAPFSPNVSAPAPCDPAPFYVFACFSPAPFAPIVSANFFPLLSCIACLGFFIFWICISIYILELNRFCHSALKFKYLNQGQQPDQYVTHIDLPFIQTKRVFYPVTI